MVTVGASGAIFGVLAIWTVDVFQDLNKSQTKCRKVTNVVALVSTIVISLAFGLLPLVDNWAHIGGYLFGLELSLILILKFNWDKVWKRNIRYVLLVLFILVFLGNFIGFYVLLYFGNVETYCSWCHYVNCIPYNINGHDWCS